MNIDNYLVDGLAKIGLTQYQARAYIASVVLGEASAYLIAQESDVPRSKVYEALDNLVDIGFMSKIPSDKGTLYRALSPLEAFDNKVKEITTELSKIKKEINQLGILQRERSIDAPITIFNNLSTLLGMLNTNELYEAWIDNALEDSKKIIAILMKKKCEIHFVTSSVPLTLIIGSNDSYFIRGLNSSQIMIKFSHKIMQQILGMIEKTKFDHKEMLTRESGVRILRESSITDVEDSIKTIIPGFDLKQEKILFWDKIDEISGAFASQTPCDCFITESRILLSTVDGRVFARSLQFIQKIELMDNQIHLVFSKVDGFESLSIKTIPYAKVLNNLLFYILQR